MKVTIQAHKKGKKKPIDKRDENLQLLCTKDLNELRLKGAGPDSVKIRFAVEDIKLGGDYDGEISLNISELYTLLAAAHEQIRKTDAHTGKRLDRLEKKAELPPIPLLDLTRPKAAQ